MNLRELLTHASLKAVGLLALSATLVACDAMSAFARSVDLHAETEFVGQSSESAASQDHGGGSPQISDMATDPVTTGEFEPRQHIGKPREKAFTPAASTPFAAKTIRPIKLLRYNPNLWDALIKEMQLSGAHPSELNRERRWLRANERHIVEVLGRGRRYLPHVLEAVASRDMPGEIALIPAIESGFRPDVQSPNGADGLWQFMPGTARRYGLRQTRWYDGRRDAVASTEAALDYLQALNQRFEGNWLVSISAYNCGEGLMRRVLRRANLRAKDADLTSLMPHLPKETRRYLPRLLALAELVRSPAAFGVRLPPSDATPKFTTVQLGGPIELAVAAELIGVETSLLAELNPALRRTATGPDGPHRLLVLPEHAPPMRRALATMSISDRVLARRHQVRRGENLSSISKRYGVRVKDLMRGNGLSSALIRAGDELRVPSRRGGLSAGPKAQLAPRSEALYRVRSGDSLWRIARHHNTTVERLLKLNRLTRSSVLRPGQTLRVA